MVIGRSRRNASRLRFVSRKASVFSSDTRIGDACLAALLKSVSENSILGSTGHWPVPSGDSLDGTGRASPTNEIGLLLGAAMLVPVGGSPTGTGGSPVPPIFQTRSEVRGGPPMRACEAHGPHPPNFVLPFCGAVSRVRGLYF